MRVLFFLIFSFFWLYGAPIETKLLDANSTKVYPVYLLALEKVQNEDNATVQLQKSLLTRLIELTAKREQDDVVLLSRAEIKNSKEYIEAFYEYVEKFTEGKSIKNELKQKEEKISYLKNQIFASDDNQSLESNQTLPSVMQLQYAFYVKSYEKLQERHKKLKEAKMKTSRFCWNVSGLSFLIKKISAKSPKRQTKSLKICILNAKGWRSKKKSLACWEMKKGSGDWSKRSNRFQKRSIPSQKG